MQSLEEQITELRAELRADVEARVGRLHRRIRVQNLLLGLATVASFSLAAWTPAGAQAGDVAAGLAARLAAIENKTADFRVDYVPNTEQPKGTFSVILATPGRE